jgi:hypothetical protein
MGHHRRERTSVGVGDDAEDLELTRIVDDRLDPQDGRLVVDLHPVGAHPVADPPALGPALGVGDHLGRERGVQLAAQEPEHVLGAQVERGVMDQVGPDVEQLRP